jgi:hypothetical protein
MKEKDSLIKTDLGNGRDQIIKNVMKKLPNGDIEIISFNVK